MDAGGPQARPFFCILPRGDACISHKGGIEALSHPVPDKGSLAPRPQDINSDSANGRNLICRPFRKIRTNPESARTLMAISRLETAGTRSCVSSDQLQFSLVYGGLL